MKPSAVLLAATLTAATWPGTNPEGLSVSIARTLRIAGCYSGISRGLARESFIFKNNSALKCATFCVEFDDSKVVAVSGDSCRCGTNILPPTWTRDNDEKCDIQCSGKVSTPEVEGFDDGSIACGGAVSGQGLKAATYWTVVTPGKWNPIVNGGLVEGHEAYGEYGFEMKPPSNKDMADHRISTTQSHDDL